jgi:cephalosporin hydroxylase
VKLRLDNPADIRSMAAMAPGGNTSRKKSPTRAFLDATIPFRVRWGFTRSQIISPHWWWCVLRRTHPQVLQTDLYREETELLLKLFREARPATYLEIGVFWGGTFKAVLECRDAASLTTKCIALDLWDEVKDPASNTHISGAPNRGIVGRALKKRGLGNFELLAGLSSQVGDWVKTRIDFVFHDANHTYAAVKEDLELLHPLMSDGAMMLVHNASKDYEPDCRYYAADGGPYQAIEDLVQLGKWEFSTLEKRLAVLKRRP